MDQNWTKSSYLIKTCAFLLNLGLNNVLCSRWNIDFATHTHLIWPKKILLFLGLKNEPKINKTCSNGSYPFTFTTQKSIWFFKLHETIFLVVIKCSFWDTVTNRLNSLAQLIDKKRNYCPFCVIIPITKTQMEQILAFQMKNAQFLLVFGSNNVAVSS